MTPEQASYIVDTLKARVPGLRAVYVFGSQVIDGGRYATEESDFDIAYFARFEPSLLGWDKLSLQSDLALALGVEWVDLIDLGIESDYVLFENVMSGQRLWVGDLDAVESWELGRAALAREWHFRNREMWAEELADIRRRVAQYRAKEGSQP